MRIYVALVLLALVVSGCSSSGNEKVNNETIDTISTKVTKGVTTEDQVKAIYGEPANIYQIDTGEAWHYDFRHTYIEGETFIPIVGPFVGGAHTNENEVVFVFDKNKIVQNYTVHATNTDISHSKTETRKTDTDASGK